MISEKSYETEKSFETEDLSFVSTEINYIIPYIQAI